VIALSPEAANQVDTLIEYSEKKGRLQASVSLPRSLERANERIVAAAGTGFEVPRTYPALKSAGRRWIIEGRYWISYTTSAPLVISDFYYVTSDIPNRF
jgi:plasmid stabilization system protein ParE